MLFPDGSFFPAIRELTAVYCNLCHAKGNHVNNTLLGQREKGRRCRDVADKARNKGMKYKVRKKLFPEDFKRVLYSIK
jgi:hypothetical protein